MPPRSRCSVEGGYLISNLVEMPNHGTMGQGRRRSGSAPRNLHQVQVSFISCSSAAFIVSINLGHTPGSSCGSAAIASCPPFKKVSDVGEDFLEAKIHRELRSFGASCRDARRSIQPGAREMSDSWLRRVSCSSAVGESYCSAAMALCSS